MGIMAIRGAIMSKKHNRAVARSFCQLKNLLNQAGIRPRQRFDKSRIPPIESKERTPESRNAAPEFSDRELFLKSMTGVRRASWRRTLHPSARPAHEPENNLDQDNLKLMQSSLDERSPMDILGHPEYIEGWIGVAGRRFLPNLRSGLYSIQGQIDLHGYNRTEARLAVEEYIRRMSRFHSCCIKIIHGRGINSPTDTAALKETLQRLLTTRRMSRYVVAYASAPSCDGGVGAVYVLLKNP
jgi:DNA-nicking Smr family endonuclease